MCRLKYHCLDMFMHVQALPTLDDVVALICFLLTRSISDLISVTDVLIVMLVVSYLVCALLRYCYCSFCLCFFFMEQNTRSIEQQYKSV